MKDYSQTKTKWFPKALFVLLISAIIVFATACTPATVSYFPVQQTAGLPSLTGLNSGKLVLKDGCLRLEWSGTSHLLIWPDRYSYGISGSDVDVLDENGDVVARTGQFKQLGGGEVSSIEAHTGTLPPENYSGPYWLVGGIVGNWYFWDIAALQELGAVVVLVLAIGIAAFWLIKRRKG